ncbi:FAD-binding dehydrogenase [Dermacoccaceae bacterium W4C1]
MDADVIVVGAGLAGLVAVDELVAAGKKVAVVDQTSPANLGGQAWWSLGGLFLVDTPQQRRLGVKDSLELAWQDWQGSAGWDRPQDEDVWATRWGRAYVEFAAGEKRTWLADKGVRLTPMVGWAERGDGRADGHGNSVPRFHIAWGAGTGVVGPFAERAVAASRQVTFYHRHRVTELVVTDGAVTGVRGQVLADDDSVRGAPATREVVGEFELSAPAVLVSSGGIGANHDLVRQFWPERMGTPPAQMVTGVPDYVDGSMLAVTEAGGARLVNRDRMWHYTEGIQNWDPIWPGHGIRILPGPSPLWFDALGRRLPAPYLPGYDTLGTLRHLCSGDLAQHDHSWFVLTQKMIEKEFALSGSEQNPDLVSGDIKKVLKARVAKGAPAPVEAFKSHGADFVVADTLDELVAGMNGLTGSPLIDGADLRRRIEARDREMDNAFTKDVQVMGIHNARRSRADKLGRVASPHKVLDPKAGPLIAVRLHILTRKTLGGVQTDLDSRAIGADGNPVPGLYAAGEVAGFGGGGVHGYNALEGTFLGGCLFSGRAAGRAMAAQVS